MAKAKNYTKPELRERIKKKVTAGTKGGRAGQWSARKAQLVAAEYEKAGGGYEGAKESGQKHLDQWTDEEWTTDDGKPAARRTKAGNKTMARYLPKKAWDKLNPAEKKATESKKRTAKKGEQFVANTKPAKKARRSATGSKSKAKSRNSK